VLGAVALLLFVGYLFVRYVLEQVGVIPEYERFAVYEDKVLVADERGYYELAVGGKACDNRIGNIYFRRRDGRVISLREVTEEIAAEETLHTLRNPGRGHSVYLTSDCGFAFQDGVLMRAYLSTEFATSRDGPFYTLPIDEATMKALFGEPVRYSKREIHRP